MYAHKVTSRVFLKPTTLMFGAKLLIVPSRCVAIAMRKRISITGNVICGDVMSVCGITVVVDS